MCSLVSAIVTVFTLLSIRVCHGAFLTNDRFRKSWKLDVTDILVPQAFRSECINGRDRGRRPTLTVQLQKFARRYRPLVLAANRARFALDRRRMPESDLDLRL